MLDFKGFGVIMLFNVVGNLKMKMICINGVVFFISIVVNGSYLLFI